MNALKVLALLLIVGGVLGLIYHRFSYTRETHATDIGSLHLAVSNTKSIDVPDWVGVGAIVAGAALLIFGSRSKS